MQLEALQSLQKIRSENKNKAIIISATGSGKTYLSVFDAYNFKPHRLLFVAHREQLLKSAQNSFKFVFKDMKSYGLLSGNSKETNKDFIFATVQTLIDDN
ncbi:DEAD/DEAH box helicase family protein [bacterium]|nr:DEAD/DEAH box helicase family protein [bacterium]MBR2652137.1 DEAD/DEAH box helicase family protein [bacterium]